MKRRLLLLILLTIAVTTVGAYFLQHRRAREVRHAYDAWWNSLRDEEHAFPYKTLPKSKSELLDKKTFDAVYKRFSGEEYSPNRIVRVSVGLNTADIYFQLGSETRIGKKVRMQRSEIGWWLRDDFIGLWQPFSWD